MRAAFTIWNERISPVFDVARYVLLLDANDHKEILHRQVLALPQYAAVDKLTFLCVQDVNLLVCGAISRSLQCAIEARNICIYPFCAGHIDELILDWQNGRLDQACFAMPGCITRKRRMHGKRNSWRSSTLPCGRGHQKNRRQ